MDKQIIINGVNVSGCCQYMPRHMEDYDIDTLDYCRHHFKPCKDVDVKYCYYKQLKAKEQENNQLKEDEKSLLNVIDDLQKEKNKWVEKYNDLGQDFDQLKHKEQALDEIEKYLDVQQKYFDGEDYHNLLDIIDKTKERKCT